MPKFLKERTKERPRGWKVAVAGMSRVCQSDRQAGEFGKRWKSNGHEIAVAS